MSKSKKKKECCGIYAGQDCEPLTATNNGCMYHTDNKKPKKKSKNKS